MDGWEERRDAINFQDAIHVDRMEPPESAEVVTVAMPFKDFQGNPPEQPIPKWRGRRAYGVAPAARSAWQKGSGC